jgi:hypothetical protein
MRPTCATAAPARWRAGQRASPSTPPPARRWGRRWRRWPASATAASCSWAPTGGRPSSGRTGRPSDGWRATRRRWPPCSPRPRWCARWWCRGGWGMAAGRGDHHWHDDDRRLAADPAVAPHGLHAHSQVCGWARRRACCLARWLAGQVFAAGSQYGRMCWSTIPFGQAWLAVVKGFHFSPFFTCIPLMFSYSTFFLSRTGSSTMGCEYSTALKKASISCCAGHAVLPQGGCWLRSFSPTKDRAAHAAFAINMHAPMLAAWWQDLRRLWPPGAQSSIYGRQHLHNTL